MLSIESAIKKRYKLSNIVVNSRTISRRLGKCEPNIDNLALRHLSGIYHGITGTKWFYFFQKPFKKPPSFPSPYDKAVWEKNCAVDQQQLESFMNHIDEQQLNDCKRKRIHFDSINVK